MFAVRIRTVCSARDRAAQFLLGRGSSSEDILPLRYNSVGSIINNPNSISREINIVKIINERIPKMALTRLQRLT